MRRFIDVGIIFCLLGLFVAASVNAQRSPSEPPRVPVDALMHAKLASSQELIKGLALEDYQLIHKHTQKLELLSLDAGWNTIQTKDYARISKEFRAAARQMKKASNEKNLDAAAIGYMKLTMSCIDCHRHVRTAK